MPSTLASRSIKPGCPTAWSDGQYARLGTHTEFRTFYPRRLPSTCETLLLLLGRLRVLRSASKFRTLLWIPFGINLVRSSAM